MSAWRPTRSVIVGVVVGLFAAGGLVASAYKPTGKYPEDDGTLAALERAIERGIPDGVWILTQPTATRTCTFAADPEDAAVTLFWRDVEKYQEVHAVARREFADTWFGDLDLFRRNYRPTGPARTGKVGDARAVLVDWGIPGCEGCGTRTIAVDPGTGLLLGIEDRSHAGATLRKLALDVATVDPSKVRDTPPEKLRAARLEARRPSAPRIGMATHTWAEFVAQVPMPIYEPARLPRGFVRVDYSFRDDAPRIDPLKRPMNVVGVTFGDGVARMLLIFASTEDLRRLDDLARRLPQNPEVCAPLQDEPEERVASPDAVRIFRRANLCRAVHRREFPDTGVSVALLSYNERDDDVYVETLRSLVRAR